MKRRAIPAVLLTLPLLLGGCLFGASAPAGVAMTVDGANLPRARYDHLLQIRITQASNKGVAIRDDAASKQRLHDIQVNILSEMLGEYLVDKFARDRHISVSDAEIEQATAEAQSAGGATDFNALLDSQGLTLEDFKLQLRFSRLRAKLGGADKNFEAEFRKAATDASVSAFVAPCDQDHNYPACAGGYPPN